MDHVGLHPNPATATASNRTEALPTILASPKRKAETKDEKSPEHLKKKRRPRKPQSLNKRCDHVLLPHKDRKPSRLSQARLTVLAETACEEAAQNFTASHLPCDQPQEHEETTSLVGSLPPHPEELGVLAIAGTVFPPPTENGRSASALPIFVSHARSGAEEVLHGEGHTSPEHAQAASRSPVRSLSLAAEDDLQRASSRLHEEGHEDPEHAHAASRSPVRPPSLAAEDELKRSLEKSIYATTGLHERRDGNTETLEDPRPLAASDVPDNDTAARAQDLRCAAEGTAVEKKQHATENEAAQVEIAPTRLALAHHDGLGAEEAVTNDGKCSDEYHADLMKNVEANLDKTVASLAGSYHCMTCSYAIGQVWVHDGGYGTVRVGPYARDSNDKIVDPEEDALDEWFS